MGLLYPFPVSSDETDFVTLTKNDEGVKVELKTYGLPYIFWGYALASLAVLFFLWLAVRAPINKLRELGDGLDILLINGLEALLILTPITVLSFFFYEKRLIAFKSILEINHRLFGISFFKRRVILTKPAFQIQHHLDAPNVARIQGGEAAIGFQNKGYFVLWANQLEKKSIAIDRHSRKTDLESLKIILESACQTN
jgi:hypothetical protein